MNETLRQQLKHPETRIRHQAIVKLARMKDDEVLPLLNDISKNDPEPRLRKLAERAITHILNEYSSTISRVQTQESPPSDIPPFSNPKAEQHIQTAYRLQVKGSPANALQYLIKALDIAPILSQDAEVRQLAENLTGIDGAIATTMLTDREQRRKFFDSGMSPSSNNLPNSPSSWIIFMLFLVILSQFVWADGVEMINQALDELEVYQLKQSVRQVGDTDYYVVIADLPRSGAGYPVMIAIPDGQEDATAMLRHFSDLAIEQGAVLLVPEFDDYRFAQVMRQSDTLQAMVADVSQVHRLDPKGVMLFGFGDGAMVATRYANTYTTTTAGVLTSGATFLYPPPENVPYTIMYGADDSLLRNATDDDVAFANIEDWSSPLNYLTIENIGHEINSQQIDLALAMFQQLYP